MVAPVVWGLLGAFAVALSWATGTAAIAWVGYLMLGGLALAVALTQVGGRSLVAERRLSADRVHLGGRVEVEVSVTNRGRLPVLWAVVAEALPAGVAMTGVRGRVGAVPGRGRFRFRYTLKGTRRGYYRIGPTMVRVGDLFGLAARDRVGSEASGLTVYPRIVPITQGRLPSRRSGGDIRARHRALEDPLQVIGIRPYQRSDGLRRVHWRATAHTGKLQSKLYDVSSLVETAIALNLERASYPPSPEEAAELTELAILVAASIAHHVLERRQRTSLLVVGRDLAAGGRARLVRVPGSRDPGQLAAILSALGRAALGQGDGLAEILASEKPALPWGALVVAVTPSADEALLRTLAGLRVSGFGVQVVLVGRGARPGSELAGPEAMGIATARVRTEADIGALGI